MQRAKKPNVQIKRQRGSLGWVYRIYIDGTYMATGLTRASARESVARMVELYDRVNSCALKSAIASSRVPE